MHVALSAYFWDQPRTGSGHYLHHLWTALNTFNHPALSHDTFSLLRPPPPSGITSPLGITNMEVLPDRVQITNESSQDVIRNSSFVIGAQRLSNSRRAKIAWEQRGVTLAARRHRAHMLHIPYLSAPLWQPCPTVVTAHDMIPWVLPGYAGSLPVRLYLALSVVSVKRATLIIADSQASRRDVIRVLGIPASRVHTVYLGVTQHPHFSSTQLTQVRARYGLPPDYAFYMGGFDTRKNVPLLLRAWRGFLSTLPDLNSLPDLAEVSLRARPQPNNQPVLAIGGAVPDPSAVVPDIKGGLDSLGWGSPNAPVRFLGPIPEEDKSLLMAAARLFVYPSAYEGFGLDPLEAMSAGCPVVSSSGGSLKEVVGQGGLLVPPSDEKALVQAISRVWSDPALRAELSQKGKACSRLFTWQKTAHQTHDLYLTALHSLRRVPSG